MMIREKSLYAASITVLVRQFCRVPVFEKNWETLSWLPENILFDIFYEIYSNAGLKENRKILNIELKDFDLFSKLLRAGDRRSCLHKIVQFCSDGNPSFFSPLIQEFKENAEDLQNDAEPIISQRFIETGLNFGGFLCEGGYFAEAANVYRACLSAVKSSSKALFWRVEIQSRLLNSLSNFYLLKEASEVYHQLNKTVKTVANNLPRPLLCRVYTEFSTHHFLRSEYQESFSWAMKAVKLLNLDEVNIKLIIDVLRQASKSCIVKREFSKAEMLIKQAISLCRNEYGTSHAKYADCLTDYGFYLLLIDRIGPSTQVYQSALDLRLEYFGGNNLKVAVAHEDLAYSCYVLEYSSGNFQEARKHAESSLVICEDLLPENHLLLASPKRVLALILEEIAIDNVQDPPCKDSLLSQAENLHLFALRTALLAFGERNVQTAKHYGNLGRLYQTMRRYSEAEKMHLKAIQIKEALLGPEDYEVALSVGHLASLYNYDMAEFNKAEQLYLRSISIGIKLFGPTYSGLEYDYRGLIQVYQLTANHEKCSEYTNVLQSWNILKDEKESLETENASLTDVTSVPLAEMLNKITDGTC